MTGEEALARIRGIMQQKLTETPAAQKLIEKINSGKADLNDTSLYARWAAINLGMCMSDTVCQIDLHDRPAVCKALLFDQYEDINGFLGMVQKELDSRFGLHIAPKKAPFPEERVEKLGNSLTDQTVPESTIQRRARAGTETVTKSFHDDYVKANAKFRHRAGLDCRITRVAVNGCCPWCSKVAGRYRYGEEPEGIYKRHDNCDCTVTFENGRKRQDVWSKREWEAPKEDAGAGEPVVLTREQAAALQKEKQLSYLTGGVKHGKLNAEEKAFLDRILADPDMSLEYRQILMDRFSSGSEIAQKAFAKFVPDNSVSYSNYTTDSAFYWKRTKSISMSYERDQNHWALKGSTWFHEHGHLIDDFAGQITFNHPEYLDAIRTDFAKLISLRTKSKKPLSYVDAMDLLSKKTELQKAFSAELKVSGSLQSGVSDVMEGVSGAMIRGRGGHVRRDRGYWNNEFVISSEAFAHMFEAQFDKARYMQMQMYFPNSLSMFEKLLKEVSI